MADRLLLGERLTALEVEDARLAADGAGAAAAGAGPGLAEGAGLLLEQRLEGALDQAAGGLLGDLLQGGEVDPQAGALRAEGPPGDDFAPAGRQLADVLEVLGLHSGARRGLCSSGLRRRHADAFLPPFYTKPPNSAKPVLASCTGRGRTSS
jgi:hypothetical protein